MREAESWKQIGCSSAVFYISSLVLSKINVEHSYKAAVWFLQPVFLFKSSSGTCVSLQWAVLKCTVKPLKVHAAASVNIREGLDSAAGKL